MNVEGLIAEAFLNVKYDDIPSDIIDITKKQILDGLGVILAGSQASGVRELVELLKEWGSIEQATIFGYGIKVSAPNAAQANATMMHALDFDDSSDSAAMHPGTTVLPTCLALAEWQGKLSGKDFITCMALGTNLIHRLGRATRPNGSLVSIGWHTTSLYGIFGSAGISGRVLGLTLDEMNNAFGIAYHQAAGNLQCVHDGALTKRMGAGFAARGGMVSALMAQRGITGTGNWLTGRAGLINVYHNGDFDVDTLASDFVKKYDSIYLTFKPYPCCRIIHAFIDAVLKLINDHNITEAQIEEISVFAGEGAYALCVPFEVRSHPRNAVDSQFSVPWVVATAVVKKKVALSDFTEKAINDEHIIQVAGKIKAQLDPQLVGHGIQPGRVTIKTTEGKAYTAQIDQPLGNPENPLSFESIVDKFRDCASHSVKVIPKKGIDDVIELVRNLEQVDNVMDLCSKIG